MQKSTYPQSLLCHRFPLEYNVQKGHPEGLRLMWFWLKQQPKRKGSY